MLWSQTVLETVTGHLCSFASVDSRRPFLSLSVPSPCSHAAPFNRSVLDHLQAADDGTISDLLAVGAGSPASLWLFSSWLLVLALLGIAWNLRKHQGQMDPGTRMDVDGLPELGAADPEALPFPVRKLEDNGQYMTRRINM